MCLQLMSLSDVTQMHKTRLPIVLEMIVLFCKVAIETFFVKRIKTGKMFFFYSVYIKMHEIHLRTFCSLIEGCCSVNTSCFSSHVGKLQKKVLTQKVCLNQHVV